MNTEQQLHLAVKENDQQTVEKLLDAGTDINCLFYAWTPLQNAINLGLEQLAVYFIERGADIHKQHNKKDPCSFEMAVKKRLSKATRQLLEKGMDPNKVMTNGEPAIFMALQDQWINILRILIEGKADTNIRNQAGESPLYHASREGLAKVCQVLIEGGANTDFVQDMSGNQTPLIIATANEQNEVVKLLLRRGCDLNLQDADQWTALWHAYSNSDEDMMNLLLKSGAKKDIPDSEGRSLLQDATENDDDGVIELLNRFTKSWTNST